MREGLRRLNRTVEIPDPFLDSRRLEKLLCRRRGRLRGRGQRTGRSLKRCHSRRSEQRGATKTRGRSNRACEHLSSDRAHAWRSRRILRWNQRRCALFESRRCIGTRAHSLGGQKPRRTTLRLCRVCAGRSAWGRRLRSTGHQRIQRFQSVAKPREVLSSASPPGEPQVEKPLLPVRVLSEFPSEAFAGTRPEDV